MATPVIWTERALADVRSIFEYIAQTSAVYAEALAERLLARGEQLEAHPESGRMVPELDRSEVRELIESGYRLLYRVDPDAVRVLAVVHGRRAFPSRGR